MILYCAWFSPPVDNTAAIVGGVIGGILGLLLIAGIIVVVILGVSKILYACMYVVNESPWALVEHKRVCHEWEPMGIKISICDKYCNYSGTSDNGLPLFQKPPQCRQKATVSNLIPYSLMVHSDLHVHVQSCICSHRFPPYSKLRTPKLCPSGQKQYKFPSGNLDLLV